MPEASEVHRSVLPAETLGFLEPAEGGLFVDATLGMGGHTEAILRASNETRVIGIDQDPDALAIAKERLAKFGDRVTYFHGNFSHIRDAAGTARPDGVLADLGVSSLQLDSETRGFGFRFDAPLDMRMDPTSGSITAAELLATADETEIADIIYKYGEERAS